MAKLYKVFFPTYSTHFQYEAGVGLTSVHHEVPVERAITRNSRGRTFYGTKEDLEALIGIVSEDHPYVLTEVQKISAASKPHLKSTAAKKK